MRLLILALLSLCLFGCNTKITQPDIERIPDTFPENTQQDFWKPEPIESPLDAQR